MSWLGRVKDWFGSGKEQVQAAEARGVQAMPLNNPLGMSQPSVVAGDSGYGILSQMLAVDLDLQLRFIDYEKMDEYPEITSALDIYADDSTIPDQETGRTIWCQCKDHLIRDIIDDLLHRRLRVEEDVWGLGRNTAKYGNSYGEILADETGVIGVSFLPAPTMRRIVDFHGQLLGFVQDVRGMFQLDEKTFMDMLKARDKVPVNGIVVFQPWEVAHWRLRSKQMKSIYGTSVLDSSRWAWKRLTMLEDAAVVYRLTRAPARFAFFIETGDMPPAERIAYVNRVRQQYKKKKLFNTETGELEFRMNPLASDEDFWIPSIDGKDSTRIEVMNGPDYNVMDDIEYFRQKLVSALKVPKSYLGLGEETNKASLSQEDVRFARTEMRLQREMRNGLAQICRVHLAILGIDPDSVKWDLKMTVPSSILELGQIEVRSAQAQLAASLDPYFTKRRILTHILGLSEDEADREIEEKREEGRDDMVSSSDAQAEVMSNMPAPPEAGADMAPAMEGISERLDSLMESVKNQNGTTNQLRRRIESLAPAILRKGRKTG